MAIVVLTLSLFLCATLSPNEFYDGRKERTLLVFEYEDDIREMDFFFFHFNKAISCCMNLIELYSLIDLRSCFYGFSRGERDTIILPIFQLRVCMVYYFFFFSLRWLSPRCLLNVESLSRAYTG